MALVTDGTHLKIIQLRHIKKRHWCKPPMPPFQRILFAIIKETAVSLAMIVVRVGQVIA